MAPLILNAAITQVDFGLAAEDEDDELGINLETYFESFTAFIFIYILSRSQPAPFFRKHHAYCGKSLWPTYFNVIKFWH